MTPITLKTLLENDDYRAYFRRAPRPFRAATPQYGIIAITPDGRYGKTLRPTFKEAWEKARVLLDDPRFRDVDIFTRNRIIPPPAFAAELLAPAEDWCGRCRRPSIFRVYGRTHPALRDAPVIVEGQRRCYFCGLNYDMAQGMGKS
jgi:hypothetical protein